MASFPGSKATIHHAGGSRRVMAAAGLCLVFGAGPAAAQSKSLAQSLFEDGRKMMAEKNYDKACRLLSDSEKLEPALGTLLNLALCHEAQGKSASAWAEFAEARDRAVKNRDAAREKFARKKIAELEHSVPRLTIAVSSAADIEGLSVTLDGAPVARAAWGTAVPVDPGTRQLRAEAPGHKPWSRTLDVQPASRPSLDVPLLERVASPAASSSAPEPAAPPTGRRTAGYVVGGLGLVSLAVGIGFGARAASKWSDSNAHCPGERCTPQGAQESTSALHAARVADIALGIGILGLGVGTWLVLSSPRQPQSAASGVRIGWTAASSGPRLHLEGAW